MSTRAVIPPGSSLRLASRSLLGGLLLLSLAVNVAMALRVRSVMARLAQPTTLNIGDPVPPIALVDLQGRDTRLAYDIARDTVIYYFSPKCPWSQRNERNIASLVTNMSQKYRFVGYTTVPIARTETKLAQSDLIPILTDGTDASRSLRLEYKLVGTPQTIVISRDGRVIKNWQGAYTGDLKSEVERFFGVQLPDLLVDNDQHEGKR